MKIPVKDWLIFLAFWILVGCLFEIQRLKRVIADEAKKKFCPHLMLELNAGEGREPMGIYIKNESFFLAQDIKLAPSEIAINDFGFTNRFIVEFEGIETLRQHERRQLVFRVFDRRHQFLPEVTEKFIPHLASPSFKVSLSYQNIEGLRFEAVISKKGKNFFTEKIELKKQPPEPPTV